VISAAFDSKLSWRLLRNLSTSYPPQPGLVYIAVPRPLLRFGRFTVRIRRLRISHPSGSRRLCFKRRASKHGPRSVGTPEDHRCSSRGGSATCRVQLDGLLTLWLLANPLGARGLGESRSKTITGWLFAGATVLRGSYQLPFWISRLGAGSRGNPPPAGTCPDMGPGEIS
jgi:hypothetical protein